MLNNTYGECFAQILSKLIKKDLLRAERFHLATASDLRYNTDNDPWENHDTNA